MGSSGAGSSEPATPRRSSLGEISITEFSTDDGAEPGSPNAFGFVDWSDTASTTSHIFVPTSSSLDSCYLAAECLHTGHRVKCVACRVISHEGCISTLNDRFPCKETFRECVRKYREQVESSHQFLTFLDQPFLLLYPPSLCFRRQSSTTGLPGDSLKGNVKAVERLVSPS